MKNLIKKEKDLKNTYKTQDKGYVKCAYINYTYHFIS